MASYTVDIPGQGSYTVDSPNDLTDAEAIAAVVGQINSGQLQEPSVTAPPEQAGTYEKAWGSYDPTANFAQNYAGITGRRVGTQLDALLGIPQQALNVVTGGDRGRLSAVLKLLQGLTSPFSAVTAPVEAAAELPVTTLTGSPEAGRLAGDVTGLAATFGLGLASKAGLLGETAENTAKFLGVGRAKTFDEWIRHDPQAQFIATRGREVPEDIASSVLEAQARTDRPLEDLAAQARALQETRTQLRSTADLALDVGRPKLAASELEKLTQQNDEWINHALANNTISEMPAEPIVEKGKVVFAPNSSTDMNILQWWRTPGGVASTISPEARAVAFETNLTNMNILKSVEARVNRSAPFFQGLTDEEVRKAYIVRSLKKTRDEIEAMPETLLNTPTKKLVYALEDIFKIDKEVYVPRRREQLRSRVEAQVEEQFGIINDAVKEMEVNRRLQKLVPDADKLSPEDYILEILSGQFKIIDKRTNDIIDMAISRGDWKTKVEDLVKAGMNVNDIDVKNKGAFFDSDLLRGFQGRVSRTYQHMGNALDPSREEIEAAARGEFYFQKAGKLFELFGAMKEKAGNPSGFSKDAQTVLETYYRSFERMLQISQLRERVAGDLKTVSARYPTMAQELKDNINLMYGHRFYLSPLVDNLVAATPLVRDIIAPHILERALGGAKNLLVQAMLRLSPRFHAVNSTQLFSTLWPILRNNSDLTEAVKLRYSDAGKAIIKRHLPETSSVQVASRSLGFGKYSTETVNQETAFLAMYNVARKFGFSDGQAADYAKLRGNLYSQFMGLTTDQPIAFRKLDPTGTFLMFQRFPVKQAEMMLDLIKDKNFPGAAKWLGVNLVLGGFKAATLGQAGWLTYDLYRKIEKEYGKPVADVFHAGLPALAGADVSSSVQFYNPPFGQTFSEKLVNMGAGPLFGLVGSTIRSALNNSAPDPSTASRVYNTLAARIPGFQFLKGLVKIYEHDYDFYTPDGRLNYKGDLRDLLMSMGGFKSTRGVMGVMDHNNPFQMRPGLRETFIDAMMEMRMKRDDVIDFAANRYGMAQVTGVDLGKDEMAMVQKEVEAWNNLWPEMHIQQEDIMRRAKSRMQSVTSSMAERATRNVPKAVKNSPMFQPSAIPQPPGFTPPSTGGGPPQ
jgi:hypothetical protein